MLFETALTRSPDFASSWSSLGTRIATACSRDRRTGSDSSTMMDRLARAGGDRFAIYDLENERGDAIYVHAKTVVIDDVFAMLGSDNMNRRSWTHDSELSIAVLDEEEDEREPRDPAGLGDGARRFARDLRCVFGGSIWAPPPTTVSSTRRRLRSLARVPRKRSTPGTTAGSVANDHPAGFGVTPHGRWPPGSGSGRGPSIGRSSIPTAARAASDDPAGSDRRIGSSGGLEVGFRLLHLPHALWIGATAPHRLELAPIAAPKSSAIEATTAQSMSATIPARGP